VAYQQIDISKVRTISIKNRKSKVQTRQFAKVYKPKTESFDTFIDSLPHILVAEDLRSLVADIGKSVKKKKPVIVMIGAHVIKVGLNPLLIDLLEKQVISAIAMNSAASIHDVETAMWGTTSEDVEKNIVDGTFGMSKETGEFINGVLNTSVTKETYGYGEALGKALQHAPNKQLSLLATCARLNVPVTVHAAIGTDIIHQQPTMDGGATGEMSFRDFKVLCNVVKELRSGGVVLNIGSAVILPEVFLKVLTVVRNLGYKAQGFTTANFDMLQQYRPRMNVVTRPTKGTGTGYNFTGHHEIMIPLLCAMINNSIVQE